MTDFQTAILVGLLVAIVVFLIIRYLSSSQPDRREESMKITDHNKEVSMYEGKKIELTIAQIAEVNRINNTLTGGEFYKLVRKKK